MKDQMAEKICNLQGKQLAGSIPLVPYITWVASHSLQVTIKMIVSHNIEMNSLLTVLWQSL